MTLQAIRVAEAAAKEAQDHPIAMTPAIRLAMGWLLLESVAQYWQTEAFTNRLTTPPNPSNGPQAEYCRQRDMTIYLEAWHREVRRRDRESRS